MKTCLLIFPHQLHRDHLGLSQKIDRIFLIEESLFFKDHQYPVNFHKQKLILHRASMLEYQSFLSKQGFETHYFDYQHNLLDSIFATQLKDDYQVIVADTVDYALNRRLKNLATKYHVQLNWLASQLFINSNQQNTEYRATSKRWFMANFYQFQRKRLNIMMENGKPIGGKWSFDESNRKKIPKKEVTAIPTMEFPEESSTVVAAKAYIFENFPNAIGEDTDFYYPTNFAEADAWLEKFLTQRFKQFGPYEDALVPETAWLYHSVLTPMLNIGLLAPMQVVERSIEFAKNNPIPIESLEGFIRQIIGWREFMRATYVDLGVQMRTSNHWQHKRNIPASFYTGTTGIRPIDDVICRALKTGYCHHIERLMVLGGFMFLCEFSPNEIYHWFMEMFVDSYDWVMVTNVYAMSQNADGGLITTKPYFSGSSYLKKMGYSQGQLDQKWSAIWDGLYWRWIHIHSKELGKNPRWSMMCAMAKKMDSEKMNQHLKNANSFLSSIT